MDFSKDFSNTSLIVEWHFPVRVDFISKICNPKSYFAHYNVIIIICFIIRKVVNVAYHRILKLNK